MWFDAALMLAFWVFGWACGAATAAFFIRRAGELKPIDPALLPVELITPAPTLAGILEQIGSPYAPKPKRAWRAPPKERITRWPAGVPQTAVGAPPPPPAPTLPPDPPTAPAASPGLLPPIPWGS